MSSDRYTCTLRPELLEKAVNELNEPRDNDERLKAIDRLRDAFKEKYGKQYSLVREDDAFILRFLRSKKFNHDKALKVLANYHSVRKDIPEVFERAEDPTVLKDTLALGFTYALPHKDKNGATVLLYRSGVLNDDVDIMNILAVTMLSLEKELDSEEFQINGLSVIKDLKDLSMKVVAKMTLSLMRKMSYMTQNAMPIRYKVTHTVNEGRIFDVLYRMYKPFLTKKMQERIMVHGSDFTSLHQQIDPRYLPNYLGGTGDDPVTASIKYGKELCEWKESLNSEITIL